MSNKKHVSSSHSSRIPPAEVDNVISKILLLQAENYRQSTAEAEAINLNGCSTGVLISQTKKLSKINARIEQLDEVIAILHAASPCQF